MREVLYWFVFFLFYYLKKVNLKTFVEIFPYLFDTTGRTLPNFFFFWLQVLWRHQNNQEQGKKRITLIFLTAAVSMLSHLRIRMSDSWVESKATRIFLGRLVNQRGFQKRTVLTSSCAYTVEDLGLSGIKMSFNHQVIIPSLLFHLSSSPPGPRGTAKTTRTMRRRAKVAPCRYFIKKITLYDRGVTCVFALESWTWGVFVFSISTHWCGYSPTLWRNRRTQAVRWSTCWDQTGKLTSLIWSWTSWR